jgi:hypothetical protein
MIFTLKVNDNYFTYSVFEVHNIGLKHDKKLAFLKKMLIILTSKQLAHKMHYKKANR